MITCFVPVDKSFSQIDYDKMIDNIPFHQLRCSCGAHGTLIRHAFYTRHLKLENHTCILRVLRVKCTTCDRTHGILPSCCIPYSQLSLSCQIQIIQYYLSLTPVSPYLNWENPDISERDIHYVLSQYKASWHQRLLSFSISVCNDFPFISSCFSFCKLQFMQIRCTSNILFSEPT